jgi:hypothetical protein
VLPVRTITITVPETVAEELEAEAEASGRDLADLAGERLVSALSVMAVRRPGWGAPHTTWEEGQPVYVRPEPPAWLAGLHPENPPGNATNGLNRVVGQWPGDETDEEIEAALERLS